MNSKTFVLTASDGRPFPLDVTFGKGVELPLVIFCHGYKGFKDWGAWNLGAAYFAEHNITCLKFNFSLNGGTIEDPIDFSDLEAFGQNNYSRELDDLGLVIDWVFSGALGDSVNLKNITLIGHSRGGGIAVLKCAEDKRLSKLVTWAAVSDFAPRFPTGVRMEEWQRKGVDFIVNGRTQQKMPHYYQFYEDFLINKKRLDIPQRATEIALPVLIVQGTKDEAVDVREAHLLSEKIKDAKLFLIADADHTFGTFHPFKEQVIPIDFKLVLDKTIAFIRVFKPKN